MRRSLFALALAVPLLTTYPAGGLDTLWTLLSSLWGESTPDAGCIGDPCGGYNPSPQTDEGCIGDPSGCPKGS